MLRSPSVSSSHGLLPVLHGWQRVSQHVAGVFCLKINAVSPVNMKNISTERLSKSDCAVVKMLQKKNWYDNVFVCKGWTRTVAWVSEPLLCLQIWPERAIPCGCQKRIWRQVFQLRRQITCVPNYKLLNPCNLWVCPKAVHQKNHWHLLPIPWPSIFGVPELKADLAFHYSALSILNGCAFPSSFNCFVCFFYTLSHHGNIPSLQSHTQTPSVLHLSTSIMCDLVPF